MLPGRASTVITRPWASTDTTRTTGSTTAAKPPSPVLGESPSSTSPTPPQRTWCSPPPTPRVASGSPTAHLSFNGGTPVAQQTGQYCSNAQLNSPDSTATDGLGFTY